MQTGGIYHYVRMMDLKSKWKLKKMGLDPMGTDKTRDADGLPKASEAIKAQKLSAIVDKLRSGKKLTGGEMEFLRANSPELHRKAMAAQAEREDYERKLKNCKTKEEADNLQLSKMAQFSGEMKAIETSGMSASAKLDAMDTLQMRMAAVNDAHAEFVRKGRYEALPSDRARELREERRFERRLEDLRRAEKAQERREAGQRAGEEEDARAQRDAEADAGAFPTGEAGTAQSSPQSAKEAPAEEAGTGAAESAALASLKSGSPDVPATASGMPPGRRRSTRPLSARA